MAINKQNSRYWGTENLLIIHEHVQFNQKVTVWCEICSEKIIGPYFFWRQWRQSGFHQWWPLQSYAERFFGTISAQTWCGRPVFPTGSLHAIHRLLQSLFCDLLAIKCFLDASYQNLAITWPPRSLDLTPPDFFMWCYLKSKVYINRPQSLVALKINIEEN